MITRLNTLNGLLGCCKLNVVHVFKFLFRLTSVCIQHLFIVFWSLDVVDSKSSHVLLALHLNLLVTLDNIANLNIVVRLDVQTAILAHGNLLNIILEAAQ